MKLESTVSSAVSIGNKCKAGRLERCKVVSSSLVPAKTSPDRGSLQGLRVTVSGLKDDHVVIVPIALGASLSSEQSDVESNVSVGVATLNMPSALAAGAVKSWVVLGLNLDTLPVGGDGLWSVAHEKGRLEVVRELESLTASGRIGCEAEVDSGRVGEFKRSSDSAERVASALFGSDDESVTAVHGSLLDGNFDVLFSIFVDNLPTALGFVGVAFWVVFRHDLSVALGEGSLPARGLVVSALGRWGGSDGSGGLGSEPCWGKSSPHVVIVALPVVVVLVVLKLASIHSEVVIRANSGNTVDKVEEDVDFGVDTRASWSGATVTPRDDSVKYPGTAVNSANEWSSRVTSASVLGSAFVTSADHAWRYVLVALVLDALGLGHESDCDFLELVGEAASLVGETPTGDDAWRRCLEARSGVRETDRADFCGDNSIASEL